jgi:hypothetical protein
MVPRAQGLGENAAMATTTDHAADQDQDYQRHLRIWLGFARLIRWALGLIIVLLILMAYFLL